MGSLAPTTQKYRGAWHIFGTAFPSNKLLRKAGVYPPYRLFPSCWVFTFYLVVLFLFLWFFSGPLITCTGHEDLGLFAVYTTGVVFHTLHLPFSGSASVS